MKYDITKGGYVTKDDKGNYNITPKLKKVVMNAAQMTGGVQAVGGRTVSALKALSNKEQKFYNAGKDASKRMVDKKIWDRLMSARAKLLK